MITDAYITLLMMMRSRMSVLIEKRFVWHENDEKVGECDGESGGGEWGA